MFCIAGILFLISSGSAVASIYFDQITSNTGGLDPGQLYVDVTPDNSQVLFTINNAAGGITSSITGIYFYDGNLLENGSIGSVSGDVSFGTGATPPSLPGWNGTPSNVFYSADADSPAPTCGINPGESLGILFDLTSGYNIADVLGELSSGDLRIGLHVQGIAGAEGSSSDSFINTVPIPATAWLLGAGLFGMVGIRRKLKS